MTAHGLTLGSNPSLPCLQGCFDWWGYSGPGYASRVGTQTLVIKRELDVLMGSAPTPNATWPGSAAAGYALA